MPTINYDQIAPEYAQHRRVHPEVLRFLASRLGPSSRVLEVGCGSGNYVSALADFVGCSCCGIDPSTEMLAKAREQSERVRFKTGGAERLDFPAESFDLVFSVDVIHHVQDRSAFFREAWRVLNDGAQIWTATDSEEIIRSRQPLATYFPETVDVDLARYPSIAELRQLMEDAGFRRIEEVAVEHGCQLTDISAYRDKAFSCLHLISADAYARGIQSMEQDLKSGPLQGNSRYCLVGGAKLRRSMKQHSDDADREAET